MINTPMSLQSTQEARSRGFTYGLTMGLVMGFLSCLITIAMIHKTHRDALDECEKHLPRDQHCELTTRVKK